MLPRKSSMTVPVLSEVGADADRARSALAEVVRDIRLVGHWHAGDGPERVDGPLPMVPPLVTRKSLTGPSVLFPRSLGGVLRCD